MLRRNFNGLRKPDAGNAAIVTPPDAPPLVPASLSARDIECFHQALRQIPSVFGRLVHLASLGGGNRLYRHRLLEKVMPIDAMDRTAR